MLGLTFKWLNKLFLLSQHFDFSRLIFAVFAVVLPFYGFYFVFELESELLKSPGSPAQCSVELRVLNQKHKQTNVLRFSKAIQVQVEQRFRIHATLRTKIFAYIKSLSSNMGRWQAA